MSDTPTVTVHLTVNGKAETLTVPANRLLVEMLRYDLGLTGTHVGCDTTQCGACTVHIDGKAIKSCTLLAGTAEGAQITTIEGLGGADGALHPMQAAFREEHGLQCGFCTPGMIMAAINLLALHPDPTEDQVREGLEGNICRCTGYHNIVRAVMTAAKSMRGDQAKAA